MTTDKNQNKRPDFTAYTVVETGNDKSRWTQIGAAWKNKDGEGINITLDANPVNGRIVLRAPKQEDQNQPEPK